MDAPRTIREYLKRRVWALSAVAVGAWLLFPVSALISKGHEPPVTTVIAAVIFGSAILCLQLAVKCPKCARRLGQTIAMPVAFAGKRAPNFCPYCGISLDESASEGLPPAENVTTPDKLVWK